MLGSVSKREGTLWHSSRGNKLSHHCDWKCESDLLLPPTSSSSPGHAPGRLAQLSELHGRQRRAVTYIFPVCAARQAETQQDAQLASAQLASGAACRAATLLLSKLLPAPVALLGVMRERYMSMSGLYAKDNRIMLQTASYWRRRIFVMSF